jgi:transposase
MMLADRRPAMPSVIREKELNDRLWVRVRPLLPAYTPSPKGGRPRADDRACFEAIVYVLRNGLRWRDLPERFPSAATCWRRHAEWTGDGVWEDVWRAVLDELAEAGLPDTSELYLDCTFAPAQKGGSTSGTPSAARG